MFQIRISLLANLSLGFSLFKVFQIGLVIELNFDYSDASTLRSLHFYYVENCVKHSICGV